MRKLVCILISLLTVILLCGQVFAQTQDQDPATTIIMKYDDRKTSLTTVSGDTVDVSAGVEIVEPGVPTSYKVGTEQFDDCVLKYEDGTLYAVGVGTAAIEVNGTAYSVTVEPAVISLIMYTGHSVGHGADGNAEQSVVVEAGQAYSIYDPWTSDKGAFLENEVEGYGLGIGSEKRVKNDPNEYAYGNGSNYIDALAPGKKGVRGSGSGLAWRWNKLTGEKLFVINAAVGGSCLNQWMPGGTHYSEYYPYPYYDMAVRFYQYAQTIIKNEIAAGHYTLGHMGLLYYCGANDAYYPDWTMELVEQNYKDLWNNFSAALGTMDVNGDGQKDTISYIGLVPYWVPKNRDKMNFDKPAAQYMASNKDYPQFFVASNMIREFLWDENLENFPDINYFPQSEAVVKPTSSGVKEDETKFETSVMANDNTHPSQVAYNAIGIDTADSIYERLYGEDAIINDFYFVDVDFNKVPDDLEVTVDEPYLITPWFEPFYADDLTYQITGDAELKYPLQIVGTKVGTATLTVKQGDRIVEQLNIKVGHGPHCFCGGTLKAGSVAATKHSTCSGDTKWVPLAPEHLSTHEYTNKSGATVSAQVLSAGNYYLQSDMTWSGTILVAPDDTVNICLNGHTLTTTGRSFQTNGTLNICDCKGGGQVYSNSTGTAPLFYVYCCGQVNIFGGSYSAVDSDIREFAGVACIESSASLCNYGDDRVGGTLCLYDGTFHGCELTCSDGSAAAAGSGGCVNVRSGDAKFYMYGGTLSGGSSLYGNTDVGTVYPGGSIYSAGTVELWGGTICNSTDPIAAVHGGGGSVTLKGDVTFKNNSNADIYVQKNKPLKVEAAQSGPVVVDSKDPGLTNAAVTVTLDLAGGITARAGYKAVWQDGNVFVVKESDLNGKHVHCVCGGKAVGVGDHKCMNVLYEEWTSTTALPTSGAYYLDQPVNTTARHNMTSSNLQLCLNGTASTSTAQCFYMKDSKADLCDCREIEGSITSSYNGGGALIITHNAATGVTKGSEFNLYSGKLIHAGTASATSGYDNAAVQIKGYATKNAQGILRMYGGTIQGGTSAFNGAAVAVQASSKTMGGRLYMYGGTIIGGNAVDGGALYVALNDAQAFVYGGTIKGSTAASNTGSNIYVEAAKLYIYGGTIEGEKDFKVGTNGQLKISGGTYTDGLSVDGATVKSVLAENRLLAKTEKKILMMLAENATTTGTESVTVISKPEVNSDLKFTAASVSLHNDLGVNFKANGSLFTAGNFTDPYVVFKFGDKETLNSSYIASGGKASFRFRDIAPHLIGDTITATLYASKDGALYVGEPVNYSVKDYCYSMLSTYNDLDYPGKAYGELRTLLVDLLNYGAAAQLYIKPDTDAFVNEDLMDNQRSWGTNTDPVVDMDAVDEDKALTDPSVKWKLVSLYLDDCVAIRLGFEAESIEELCVKFVLDGKEYEVTEFKPVADKTNEYYVYFEELNASHMRETVSATVYCNGEQVSNTAYYSVEAYVARHINNTDNPLLAALVKAIIRYGDSAYAYVN